jgi:hypothetical protein
MRLVVEGIASSTAMAKLAAGLPSTLPTTAVTFFAPFAEEHVPLGTIFRFAGYAR